MNILITGCTRGLGRTLYDELSHHHNVIPHFRTSQVTSYDNQVIGDLRSMDTIDEIEDVCMRHRVDIFINNAARYHCDIDENQDIIDMFDTNLVYQTILLTKVFRYMNATIRRKAIININSLAAKYPNPNEVVYCATKAGMSAAIDCLQMITGPVQICDILLGGMKTDMTRGRDNYDTLIEPVKVTHYIRNMIDTNIYPSEVILRKENF